MLASKKKAAVTYHAWGTQPLWISPIMQRTMDCLPWRNPQAALWCVHSNTSPRCATPTQQYHRRLNPPAQYRTALRAWKLASFL